MLVKISCLLNANLSHQRAIVRPLAVLVLVTSILAETAAASSLPLGDAGPFDIWVNVPNCAKGRPTKRLNYCISNLHPKAHIERAIIYIWYYKWREARKEVDYALQMDPTSSKLLHFSARLALSELNYTGDFSHYALAEEHLTRAQKLDPLNPGILATLGHLYGKRGDSIKSWKHYDLAIKLAPNQIFALSKRAYKYLWTDRPGLAFADFDRLVALEPKNSDWLIARAHTHFKLKRYKKALQDIAAAEKLMPPSTSEYELRSKVNIATGNLTAAHNDMNTVIDEPLKFMPFALPPRQRSWWLYRRAWLRMQLGMTAEAADDYTKSIELGGVQMVLQLQLALRRLGSDIEIDGKITPTLKNAIKACLANGRCEQKLLGPLRL